MGAGVKRRGQPLVVLGVLATAWVGLRAAFWAPPEPPAALSAEAPAPMPGPEDAESPPGKRPPRVTLPALAEAPIRPDPLATASRSRPVRASTSGRGRTGSESAAASLSMPEPRGRGPAPSMRRLLSRKVPQAARQPVPPTAPHEAVPTAGRWSADAWLLLREERTTPILSGRPSYGRSQAGAVLRYRLAPSSAHRPRGYLRASGALEGLRDREVAAGLSARPLAGLPLRLAAEMRLSETDAGTETRPAVLAITELPPLALPLDGEARIYAQGGYVGGTYATPFVDGQAKATRTLMRLGEAEIGAGLGAWGGAQEDAARLDIGPGLEVEAPLGGVRARLALDYRVRVAGDARPASGPALTLSAGF